MLKDIYRVGMKVDGKTVYHNIASTEALLAFLAEHVADAERVTITKQKLFTLDQDEKDC